MWRKAIKDSYEKAPNTTVFLNEVRMFLHELSPYSHNPVDVVRWVPITKVKANEYNPNEVADTEMRLLYTSIEHDGYTQPIVTVYNEEQDTYVIVDGFHRYSILKMFDDINKKNHGHVPVTVIVKNVADRMASTIRHNRARGKHKVMGMSKLVFDMLDEGWDDATICNELGMEPEELIRLKHITGFSKLFEKGTYNKAYKTDKQIKIGKKDDINKEI